MHHAYHRQAGDRLREFALPKPRVIVQAIYVAKSTYLARHVHDCQAAILTFSATYTR